MLKSCLNIIFVMLALFRMNVASADDATFFVKVNPAGTYLRTDSDDKELDHAHNPPQFVLLPAAATELDLTALYNNPDILLSPGDYLALESVGDFRFGDTDSGESSTGLIGVFAGTNGFLAPGPGSSTSPVYTVPTFGQGLVTDIAEDFAIPGDHFVAARIPENATKLLFSANDSNFANNSDPNNDYGVTIKIRVIKAETFEFKQLIVSDGGRKIMLPPPPPPPKPV